MKRILCLFDYGENCHTGYATVSRNIKREIKNYFGNEIALDICAVNYYGEEYTEEDGTFVFPAKLSDDKNDDFGRHIFMRALANDRYDGIFILQDIGIMQPIAAIINMIREKKKSLKYKQFKSIFYFPVDVKLIPVLTKDMEVFDVLVTYTEFARQEVLRLRPELRPKLRVIPHGNNPHHFRRLQIDESNSFRKEFYGDNADKIIVINVNRNQPRKDIPNTIFGFIEAKKMWPEHCKNRDLFLYLHCHPKDPLGHDLRAILNQTELEEFVDYMLLPPEFEENMPDIATLNKIYNASDIFLTTTLGEGWGLTVTEAFAAGLVTITPYNTSLMEIGRGDRPAAERRTFPLMTQIPYCGMFDNLIREQTDYIEVSEQIIHVAKMVNEADLGIMDSENEVYYTTLQNAKTYVDSLDWYHVCKMWIDLFKKTY